jgi:hypothetical protein
MHSRLFNYQVDLTNSKSYNDEVMIPLFGSHKDPRFHIHHFFSVKQDVESFESWEEMIILLPLLFISLRADTDCTNDLS